MQTTNAETQDSCHDLAWLSFHKYSTINGAWLRRVPIIVWLPDKINRMLIFNQLKLISIAWAKK